MNRPTAPVQLSQTGADESCRECLYRMSRLPVENKEYGKRAAPVDLSAPR